MYEPFITGEYITGWFKLPLLSCVSEYAQVIKMLGNGRLEAMCFDGTKRLCHIRGKLRKKVGMTRAPSVAFSHHHTQRKLCGVTPRQHFLRQPPSACVRVTKCSVTLCHSSLLCFVFLQVWINTSDIILVGLRDYQVCWWLTQASDQTTNTVVSHWEGTVKL